MRVLAKGDHFAMFIDDELIGDFQAGIAGVPKKAP
jgi:hypothetical protein